MGKRNEVSPTAIVDTSKHEAITPPKKHFKGKCKKRNCKSKSEEAQQKNTILQLLEGICSSLTDTRIHTKDYKYSLRDIAIAVAVAKLRGSEKIKDIHTFIKANILFFRQIGLFTNKEAKGRYPSLVTLYRLVKRISQTELRQRFYDAIQKMFVGKSKEPSVIAVDGKCMRGTSCGERNKPINILTALLTDSKVPIMAESCDEKSNEIKAWRILLDNLKGKLEGEIFTADAMGCQTHIVQKIRNMECHYCLAVKDNQLNLEKDIETQIKYTKPTDAYREPVCISHGRIEYRICEVYDVKDKYGCSYIENYEKWQDIKTVIRIKAYRADKKNGTDYGVEERFYISDLELSAKEFNSIVRSHWGVEAFHNVLDTTYRQDATIRMNDKDGASSANIDTFQKIAYVSTVIYKTILTKLPRVKIILGIRDIMIKCNASIRELKRILNIDISPAFA